MELIKDLIFCRYDTFSDRVKLLKPALFSLALSLAIILFFRYQLDVSLNLYAISITFLSAVVTCLLAQFLSYNVVLFIPSFSLFLISLYSLNSNPQDNFWVHLQVLSMIVINFIGSTRCNFINFLLLAMTSLIAKLWGYEIWEVLAQQSILFFIFPLTLYNSFYKSTLHISHINDIKKLHQVELELVEKEKSAEIALTTSIVAHEINNSLAILKLAIQRMAKELSNSEKSTSGMALKAVDKIQDIVSLIKKKSFTSKERKDFNLSDLIKDEFRLLELKLKGGKIKLSYEKIENDVFVYGNEMDLSQVISNLITNAVDAFDSYERSEEKIIEIALKSEDNRAYLTVKDNAGGVPAKLRDNIFEKGFTTKERGKGTGLGLYYVRQVLLQTNADISLNVDGHWSEFKIVFRPFFIQES